MRESRHRSRSDIIWFFLGLRGKRGFGESAVGHIAFHPGLRLNFYVALHAADDLHRFSAFQLGSEVEINHGFVNPHPVFVHGALYVRAASLCRGNPNDTCKK